jgi:hypothetical protein
MGNKKNVGLYQRSNGIWYYCRMLNGRSFRISTKTRDYAAALKFALNYDESLGRARGMQNVVALHNAVVNSAVPEWEEHVMSLSIIKGSWVNQLYASCQSRARVRKLPFFLTVEAYLSLLVATSGACSLTGIRFSFEKPAGSKYSPFRPSIDRIDCAKGYDAGNCRVVCAAVNIALNVWGDDVFKRVATGYLMNSIQPVCAVWHTPSPVDSYTPTASNAKKAFGGGELESN